MEMGKGFELANGLPFVATDKAIHELLNAHTVAEAQALQIALGKIRRASGHYNAQVLAIDPHRIPSYSKRQMRRHQNDKGPKPSKMAQTFPHFHEDKFLPGHLQQTTAMLYHGHILKDILPSNP